MGVQIYNILIFKYINKFFTKYKSSFQLTIILCTSSISYYQYYNLVISDLYIPQCKLAFIFLQPNYLLTYLNQFISLILFLLLFFLLNKFFNKYFIYIILDIILYIMTRHHINSKNLVYIFGQSVKLIINLRSIIFLS